MTFTEPLGAPDGGDSFSASHHTPDLPAPPSYDDDVVDEEKLDNYDTDSSDLDEERDDESDILDDDAIDTDESDDDLDPLDLDDELEIEDDDDGLVNDIDPEVSTTIDPDSEPRSRGTMYE